jgi:hypothetical protein
MRRSPAPAIVHSRALYLSASMRRNSRVIALTAVAAICASPSCRQLCSGQHHKGEAQMREAEMVCPEPTPISPSDGRAVAGRYPTGLPWARSCRKWA